MRLSTSLLLSNNEILPGAHLLEARDPQLARAAQPGQYCMVRCCDSRASDPLLRRPFFIAASEPERGICRFLVYERGRGSGWLTRLQAGMQLDILGPLGRGWTIRAETRNLLLIGEEPGLAAVLALARSALEREIAVTLIHHIRSAEQSYPPALLPPEVEYQVFTDLEKPERLAAQISDYLSWADAACCSVSEETIIALARGSARWRERHFAQAALCKPLACATGACLSCPIELQQGARLLCREGPVFAVRELVLPL